MRGSSQSREPLVMHAGAQSGTCILGCPVGTFKDETTCGLENSFGVQMPCVKPQWGGGATCTCCTDYYELGCVKYSSPTPSPTLPPVATSPPSPALGVSLAPKDGATSVTAQQVLIVTTSSSARLSGTPSADRALLTLTSATEGWQLIETSHQFYDTTGNTVANSIASPALETATFAEVHVTVVWVPPDDAGGNPKRSLRVAGK